MTDRNWDAELAKIDKQLASISDDQLLAEKRAPAKPGAAPQQPAARIAAPPAAAVPVGAAAVPAKGRWRGWLQAAVAVSAAAGLWFWPWPAQCGLPLYGFVAATGGVTLLGIWSAFGTWKHRLGAAHILSLAVVFWGAALTAREVLPRVGYAVPDAERSTWNCTVPPATTTPVQQPSVTPGTQPPSP